MTEQDDVALNELVSLSGVFETEGGRVLEKVIRLMLEKQKVLLCGGVTMPLEEMRQRQGYIKALQDVLSVGSEAKRSLSRQT